MTCYIADMCGPVRLDNDSDNGVIVVTLNRPEARNSLSMALLDALNEALDAIECDDSIRVVILTGEGEVFCAGMDLKEICADEATVRRMLHRLSEVMRRIRRLPIATIARVRGAAIGGGFGLMLVADFAVTHAEAKIGYPPLDSCLMPAVIAPWLVRKVGTARAGAMLLAGGAISGKEAHEAGIVTHLAPIDKLDRAARDLAHRLAEAPHHAMTAMKRFLIGLDAPITDEMLDLAAEASISVVASPHAQDRLRAMLSDG